MNTYSFGKVIFVYLIFKSDWLLTIFFPKSNPGTFNQSIDVSIKIVPNEEDMQIEMNIYKVLKATENFDIKKHRIPRLYYHGPILGVLCHCDDIVWRDSWSSLRSIEKVFRVNNSFNIQARREYLDQF